MRKTLLIVDIQNDYFPGGLMSLHNPIAAAENASTILRQFRKNEDPVIFLQHIASPDSAFFRPESEGGKIHELVEPQAEETIIQKAYPNGFHKTNLLGLLEKPEKTELVICGMMTHMCIDSTVRAAFDLGFKCTLIGDACASRELFHEGSKIPAQMVHNSFLAAIHGTFAEVSNTTDYLNMNIIS